MINNKKNIDKDDELQKAFVQAVRMAKKMSKIKGNPVAEYDVRRKKAYLKYADGRKEYV